MKTRHWIKYHEVKAVAKISCLYAQKSRMQSIQRFHAHQSITNT